MGLTKTQIENLKVGQELFWENGQGKHHWNGRKITIEKIGNKYAYAGRIKISLMNGRVVSDFTGGTVWINEQEYYDQVNLEQAWNKFRLFCYNTYNAPSHLSIEAIRELSERVGVI